MNCDSVVDLVDERLDALPIPDTSAQGFVVTDYRVQLRGLCRRCRQMEEKP
jgi:Fe2+ or Zn2+ uptake regulation protein